MDKFKKSVEEFVSNNFNSISAALHSAKLGAKVSAGPLTVALTDKSTAIIYYISATVFI